MVIKPGYLYRAKDFNGYYIGSHNNKLFSLGNFNTIRIDDDFKLIEIGKLQSLLTCPIPSVEVKLK